MMLEQNPPHLPHLTRQRRLVWEVLKDAREHLDAENIYLRAKARNSRISLATVYRSLNFLKHAGLVQEISLGENHSHYETAPAAPHQHFTCLGCNKVIELDHPQLERFARQAAAQKGLHIVQIEIHLSGYCPDCAPQETRR